MRIATLSRFGSWQGKHNRGIGRGETCHRPVSVSRPRRRFCGSQACHNVARRYSHTAQLTVHFLVSSDSSSNLTCHTQTRQTPNYRAPPPPPFRQPSQRDWRLFLIAPSMTRASGLPLHRFVLPPAQAPRSTLPAERVFLWIHTGAHSGVVALWLWSSKRLPLNCWTAM